MINSLVSLLLIVLFKSLFLSIFASKEQTDMKLSQGTRERVDGVALIGSRDGPDVGPTLPSGIDTCRRSIARKHGNHNLPVSTWRAFMESR